MEKILFRRRHCRDQKSKGGIMIKDYELMVMFTPKLKPEEADLANEAILNQLKEAGAEIIKTDPWGKKMLAYPIDKLQEAYYYVNYLKFESLAVKDIQASFNINEKIIRHMFVALDSK